MESFRRRRILDLRSVLGVVDRPLPFVLAEVVHVHFSEFAGLCVKGSLVGPGGAWVQNVRVQTRQRHRDIKSKDWIGTEGSVVDGTIQNSINASASGIDAHARSDPVRSTTPPGIDQIRFGTVLIEFFLEEVGVSSWMDRHKGSSKASGEGGRGFLNATFRAGHFGRVAREEMVHGLTGSEACHGRQNAKSVARQEDNVLGMAGHLGLML